MNQSVQGIVELVHASGSLGKSKRQGDLLRYLLTEKEQGRLDSISQYSIAIDVLGRPANFDPSIDSIVRGEMHRLRKNLKQFNGQSKDLHLKIPRAEFEVVVKSKTENQRIPFLKTYYKPLAFAATALVVATFGLVTMPPNTPTSALASNCSSIIPNVSVVNSGRSTDLQSYVGKIIRSSLSQYTNIQLVDDIQVCAESGTPSFTLDYMVFWENGTYRIALTTYNDLPSNIVGFTNIGGVIANPDDKDDLYYAVVRSISGLAKPYGTISRYAITEEWASGIILVNYRCLITMHDSFTTESNVGYAETLNCLKRSVESGFASLDNIGGLAASYIEQQQNVRNHSVQNPMVVAQHLIDGVGDTWINSTEITIAKIAHEVERHDYNAERLKDLLDVAEKKYDTNPQILLTIAIYSGFKLGDWDHAKYLSDKVKRIHYDRDNSVFIVDVAYALLNESAIDAMRTCLLLYSEESLLSNLIINGCARQAQNIEWSRRTDANLIKLNYTTTDQKVAYIQNRNLEPLFTKKLLTALKQEIN